MKTQLQGEFEMKDLGTTKKYWVWGFIETEKHGNCTYHRKGTLRKYWNTLECKGNNQ